MKKLPAFASVIFATQRFLRSKQPNDLKMHLIVTIFLLLVCSLLEQEKSEHRDLKETWRKANEQFLDQQMMLSWEIDKMRQLLTPAQMEKLSKEFRKTQAQPAKKIKTVAEEPYILKKSNEDLISFDDEKRSGAGDAVPRALTPSDVRIQEVCAFIQLY